MHYECLVYNTIGQGDLKKQKQRESNKIRLSRLGCFPQDLPKQYLSGRSTVFRPKPETSRVILTRRLSVLIQYENMK